MVDWSIDIHTAGQSYGTAAGGQSYGTAAGGQSHGTAAGGWVDAVAAGWVDAVAGQRIIGGLRTVSPSPV